MLRWTQCHTLITIITKTSSARNERTLSPPSVADLGFGCVRAPNSNAYATRCADSFICSSAAAKIRNNFNFNLVAFLSHSVSSIFASFFTRSLLSRSDHCFHRTSQNRRRNYLWKTNNKCRACVRVCVWMRSSSHMPRLQWFERASNTHSIPPRAIFPFFGVVLVSVWQ